MSKTIPKRRGLLVIDVLGLLAALACPAAGQSTRNAAPSSQSIPPNGFSIHVQSDLVLVDVRVWDKQGKPVTNLKPGDFIVYEDGVEQKINSFSLEDVSALAQAAATNGAPAIIDFSKLPPTANPARIIQDHRLLVFFFDLTAMPVDDMIRAVEQAQHFINQQATPADLVAVATYSSDLRVVQDFTNDKAALTKGLNSIRVGESSSLAEAGSQGDAGTTNANGEEIVSQDVSAAYTPDETEFNIFNTDEKLAALESIAQMLRPIPGRKSVIHFSSGIERTGVENQAQLRATIDAANRSNVSFYTIDARGLAALPPGGDASSSSPSGAALYTGSAAYSQLTSLQEGRETLASLATDTGGKTYYDLNDFSSAFTSVLDANSVYYLLGYSPSNTKSDGRFRRIRVEVDVPGLKVQSRPGYFAAKNFRQFTREDKELQLQQAMNLDVPFVDLPFVIDPAYFRQPDGKFYIVLAAKIPGSAISFLDKSQVHQTEFDFVWRADNAKGQPEGMLRDTLPVKLSGEDYENVLHGNILYTGGMVLPPGKYTLKVVVRENESGKMGTFEEPLDLPAYGISGLNLSSVILSSQLGAASNHSTFGGAGGHGPMEGRGPMGPMGAWRTAISVQNPLEIGKQELLPSVTRVFRTNQFLYVYLQSYRIAGAEKKQPATSAPTIPPQVALVFFRGGVKVAEAGPFTGKVGGGKSDETSYFVRVLLDKFPPGRYWLQLNVLDPAANQVSFSRIPMAIIPPPARPTAKTGGE